MPSIDLSIIIVNWNSKDYLQACLASILADTAGIDYEIIVVDSGSFDGCGEMLKSTYPSVRFTQSQHNLGFARANNLGARSARGNVLLFLNPDTEIRGRAIERMQGRLLELPKAGVVGCRLLNSDGTLQTSCVQPLPTILNQVLNADILLRLFPTIGLWTSARRFEGVPSSVPVEAISGACMMIRRQVFDQLGGYSTDYFMYAEDLDLCYKARASGFTNYYIAGAEIVHHGGGSTRKGRSRFADVMIPESISRLLKKTRGESYSFLYRLALSGTAGLRLALLGLGLPAAMLARRTSAWSGAVSKWWAILRWGIGLEKWVHQYDRPE